MYVVLKQLEYPDHELPVSFEIMYSMLFNSFIVLQKRTDYILQQKQNIILSMENK